MKIVDPEGYDQWKENNRDEYGYGMGIFKYAEKWADLMESLIEEGKQLEDIAQETSFTANTDGITGFMYGAAVAVLSFHWEHGEELRVWHNKKYGGDENTTGIINPALLSVKR
ncbi:hypothetical protein [Bacillus phage SDFMU_Pbc]|uniref:Uncharacterized protein n=1 Tax=Bacillus phage SDFMU_Pbc TaxID=3076135 RepID=A0AA96R5N7_9CAUD|nr:hypothetical protein [Bacillus phage SDFMU_Pbc]